MDIAGKINGLNGSVVDREALIKILEEAKTHEQYEAAKRIANILDTYPDETSFEIELEQPFFEELPAYILQALPEDQTDENFTGLNKAVSPDEIYQYITDLMIQTIKEVGHLPWQMEWDKTAMYQGYQALNFDSKNGYRGVNFWLTNFEQKIVNGKLTLVHRDLSNPYFLTFNQIEKHGGKLKKGSRATRVVYFTKLFHFSQANDDGSTLEFGSYNQKKFRAWLLKHRSEINVLRENVISLDRLASEYIPILKYYNVYSGHDVEGIDWGEIPKNENVAKPEKERITICEKMVEAMPKRPKIIYAGNQPAYSPGIDTVKMTPIKQFKSEQAYYSTLFHELVHATGHPKRLHRFEPLEKPTAKEYAFEELIAEMGAVYMCSEAGILFKTLHNSAKYLKGWNSRLVKTMENDNRFFFRASSRAQAAADFMLDRNNNGIAAYVNFLAKAKNKPVEKKVKEKVKPGEQLELGLALPVEILHDTKKAEKFFINWSQKNLLDKKVFMPQINKQVQFDLKGINKNIRGGMSIPMASLITQAEQLLKRASLESKKSGGSKARRIYNFRSNGYILTVDTPVKFTLIEKKNGNIHYAHDISEIKEQKEVEKKPDLTFAVVPVKKSGKIYYAPFVNNLRVGSTNWLTYDKAKNELSRFTRLFTEKEILQQIKEHGNKKGALNMPVEKAKPSSQVDLTHTQQPTVVKKTSKRESRKNGLNQPANIAESNINTIDNDDNRIDTPVEPPRSRNTVAANINRGSNAPLEFYKMPDPEIANFLDNIEIKPKESVVITLTGEKGSGKTHAIFKWINAFAQNYYVGHASLEEHPESYLYRQKAEKYFNERAMTTVEAPDVTSVQQLDDLIRNNDVIFIDSFAKLQELQSNFQVDKDLRKKYDGKLFVVIFQQTSSGKMRGGSKSEFDGDVILYTEKFSDYRENYIYTEKNRYTSKPIDGLTYNIYERKTSFTEDQKNDIKSKTKKLVAEKLSSRLVSELM